MKAIDVHKIAATRAGAMTQATRILAPTRRTLTQGGQGGQRALSHAERRSVGALAATLWLVLAAMGCAGSDHGSPEGGGADAQSGALDLCDAFTGVGTACPRAGPLVCFPMCEAGGCLCGDTPDGPQWSCVTDRSCEQVCAPIDDACASDAGAD